MDGQDSAVAGVDMLHGATEVLGAERRRIVDEISAFNAFERGVRDIDPETAGPDGGTNRVPLSGGQSAARTSNQLQTVRAAYKRTVMSVPHYAQEYGDTYTESLTEEFGTPVAVALVKGAEFTAWSKDMLLSAIQDAQSGRESMQDLVDRERTQVADATETFQTLDQEVTEFENSEFDGGGFGRLESYRSNLTDLERRCERHAERRQETIRAVRRRQFGHVETKDFIEYLYQELDVQFPVLAAYTRLLGRIADLREDVEREMAYASA
jgi:hypothetical protein